MSNATLPPKQRASAEAVVDALFQKFALMYGSLWADRWEGLPLGKVKDEWASALRGMAPQTLRLAVDHVRQHNTLPPTLPEFLAICRQFPRRMHESLALVDNRPRGEPAPPPPHIKAQLEAFVKSKRLPSGT